MRLILISLFVIGCAAEAMTYDDTLFVQDLLDTHDLVVLKKPPYHVGTLYLKNNQELRCKGQYTPCLRGIGTGPVLKTMGRHVTISDIMIENKGYPGIEIQNTPNVIIKNARIKTDGTSISIRYSWRVTIKDSFITTDGDTWAIHAIDNINGLSIIDNVISGRDLGGAINVGQSASVTIKRNIIETSLHGIWVCSVVEEGSGRCDGINVSDNYIENSSSPIKLGLAHNIWHGVVINNFISNLSQGMKRTSSINLGRVSNMRVCNNGISARYDEVSISTNEYTNAVICDNYIRPYLR